MKINSILVVGGGSSGWMAASAFCRALDNIKVSVVESKKISTVGVGESTIIPFRHFLRLINLKDEEWMKHCNASYKNSIRFTNFAEKNSGSFEYPFGGINATEETMGVWGQLSAHFKLPKESFCEFNNDNYFLAKYNRCTYNKTQKINFNFYESTAFHFDAKLFGEYLRDYVCKPEGVNHYIDDIVAVEKNIDGSISSVVGESGQKYTADLYVDCTGFKSLLIEKEMHSEFISSKPWLSNDRALATHLQYKDKKTELTNVTNCTAIENGWVWNIPLWSRIGTGYVYSSDFVDDETAEKEFKRHLGTEDIDVKKIKIKHGVHKQGWIKNVVAVGLSYAFVEPLESTGLVSTHIMIQNICELLERRNYNITAFDIDGYNYSAAYAMQGFKEFVALHYKMSSRTDTPYWKYQTEEKNWWNLDRIRDLYEFPIPLRSQSFGDIYCLLHNFHSIDHLWSPQYMGFAYIMAGMGHTPMGRYALQVLKEKDPQLEMKLESLRSQWRSHVDMVEEHVKTLPTTFEFLQETIYK